MGRTTEHYIQDQPIWLNKGKKGVRIVPPYDSLYPLLQSAKRYVLLERGFGMPLATKCTTQKKACHVPVSHILLYKMLPDTEQMEEMPANVIGR
jgi:hypothetical protein